MYCCLEWECGSGARVARAGAHQGEGVFVFVIETAERRKVAAIANLKPGETEELEVGLRAGAYTFVCTLPGHRDAGMVGRLVVKP